MSTRRSHAHRMPVRTCQPPQGSDMGQYRSEAPVMVCTVQLCRRMSQFYASSCQTQNQKFSESLDFYIR
jgi:hypothetical protein